MKQPQKVLHFSGTPLKRRLFLGPVLSLGALVAGAALLSPAALASGTTMKQYGWWNIAVYDPTLGNPTYPGPDGADLHIAYGPNPDAAEKQDTTGPVNGATQVSAVEYDMPAALPDGTPPDIQIGTLTLAVDTQYTPAVSPQASLLACTALNPWDPVLGGNWQTRVTYDAGGACAPGNFNSTTNVFTFAITAGMARGAQIIDMALVPGFVPLACDAQNNPQGCAPNPSSPPQGPWAIDLKKPTSADVTLMPVAPSGGLGSQFALPQESSATVPTLGSGLPGAAPALEPVPPSQGPAGSVTPVSRVPQTLAGNPAARLDALGRGRLLAAALLLFLFLGGLLLMGMDVQKLLTPAGQTAGIGRFARPRTGPPLPI
jgi:hypothetical protein